jgi:dipeptidyl aminopeptidase/acylaminoacyl peptidase
MFESVFRFIAVGLILVVASMAQDAGLSRISISADAPGPSRPISLMDIVELRELQESTLSPDGKRIAYLVRQGFRDTNDYRTGLYVVDVEPGSQPVKLIEEAKLTHLAWTPDGKHITYLSHTGGDSCLFAIVPGVGQAAKPVFRNTNRDQPLIYAWSPDGRTVAYAASGGEDATVFSRQAAGGIVYDDLTLTPKDVASPRPPTQLRLYDVDAGETRTLWQLSKPLDDLVWAPDGSKMAVSYVGEPDTTKEPQYEEEIFRHEVAIVSLSDAKASVVSIGRGWFISPEWSPDSRNLAFLSLSHYVDRGAIVIVDVVTGQHSVIPGWLSVTRIWWDHDLRDRLVIESYDSGTNHLDGTGNLYALTLKSRTVHQLIRSSDQFSGCTLSSDRQHAACIRQNTMTPPDPAMVDLVTGTARTVATLNPQFRNIQLANVSRMQWKNKYGAVTTGFLVKPLHYEPRKRYPLLVMLYGFVGKFTSTAEWITSYPPQAFARDGFAVLMMNYPHMNSWRRGDFTVGKIRQGYSTLASIEQGVQLLVGQGLVDSSRLGILGWSHGGFLAEIAITHSSLFRAASIGDAGKYQPGQYFTGTWETRQYYELILGGPPSGATLKNWIEFSPVFNTKSVRSSVLFEFNPEESTNGLEVFNAFRDSGVPVEFVVYPGEGHIFDQPLHKLASMQRNLDWFAFWLQSREDTDATKADQYARWRTIRQWRH